MANDINLVVGYETLKEANRAVEKLGTTAQKSASVFERAFNRVDQQQQKLAKREKASHDEWAKRQRYRVSLMENSARMAEKQARDEARAQQQAARAVEQHSKAYRDLIRSVDPAEAAVDDFTRKVDILNAEFKDRSGAEYAKRLGQIQAQASRAGVRMDKFGKVLGVTNKNARRTEIQMQQAGYQLQDFIVQVQAGTNPLIAFSQQGSQLAGFFAGPWGAAIGLGIAALGGLGTAFLTQGEKAKTFQEQMDELTSSLQSYGELVLKINDEEGLSEEFGRLANKAKEVLLALKELRAFSLKEDLSKFGGIGTVETETSRMKVGTYSVPTPFGDLELLPKFKEIELLTKRQVDAAQDFLGATDLNFGEAASYAGKYLRLLQQIQQAETFEGMVEPASELSAFLRDHLQKYGDQIKNRKDLVSMQEALLEIIGLQASQEVSAENAYQEKLKGRNKLLTQIQTDAMAMEAELAEEQIAFDKRTNDARITNENKLRVVKKRANEAAQAYIRRTTQEDILSMGRVADQLISDANVALELDERVNKQKRQAAIDTANFNFSLVEGTILDLKDEQEALNDAAEELGVRLGIGYAKALKILQAAAEQANKIGLDAFGGEGDFKYSVPTTFKPDKPNKRDEPNPLEVFKEQLELEDALKGQTEARRRIIQALGVDYMKYGTSTIKSLEDQINKTIELRKENERFAEEVEGPLTDAFGDVADAFGDFIANGLKDFKDFTKSIVSSFKQMLAQMISAALRNRIFIPITTGMSAGLGSSAAASAMGSFGGGGSFLGSMAGTLAGGASAFGSGVMAGIQGFAGGFAGGGGLAGGLSGYGATLSATAANAGIMGTIGAAVPAIAAVALVIGAFKTSTKQLDAGLKATIKTNSALIESYEKVQKSSFFGLSKRTSTSSDVLRNSPIGDQILQLQSGIMAMANELGVAKNVFSDFSYSFKVSLKGLSEEAKAQKVTEELNKLGDAFASLIPNVENLNQLTGILNERGQLEVRLLQAQGNTAALRELELQQTNEYNRALLKQVFAAEDAKAAMDELTNSIQTNAFATKVEYERAKARAAMGIATPANMPVAPTPAVVQPTSTAPTQMREEIDELRKDQNRHFELMTQALAKIVKNTKDNKNYLKNWDVIGLPAERTA